MNFRNLACATAVAVAALAAPLAQAAIVTIPQSALNSSPGVYTPLGYYTNNLGAVVVTTGGGNAANVGAADGRNDDGFRFVNLGFNVTFFGQTYNSLYINTNGNVSFGAGISSFVPSGPTGAAAPVISPYFGDVDTRGAASGVVHVNTATANQIVVTWDHVGYFSSGSDVLNSFQLVLRGDAYEVPNGEGAIGFFYQDMGWITTGTSTSAAIGFGDGVGNAEVLQGSNTQGTTNANGLNTVVANHYLWFDANLNVVPPTDSVPEPGTLLLLAVGLLGFALANRAKRNA